MMLGFAVVPFTPTLHIIDTNIGLLFFLGMTSLAVYSVLLGGLASNNKYALIGGLRSAAQMVSYEVFMGLSLMGVVMLTGSFSLHDIVEAQRGDRNPTRRPLPPCFQTHVASTPSNVVPTGRPVDFRHF